MRINFDSLNARELSAALSPMSMNDTEAVKALVVNWHETREWAEKLLVQAFDLNVASDILHRTNRGNKQIPGSEWHYRTHGVGVDIFKPGNKGGIDFDFDKPTPDPWRLRCFMIKQYNAGMLPKKTYRPLIQEEDRWDAAVRRVLSIS